MHQNSQPMTMRETVLKLAAMAVLTFVLLFLGLIVSGKTVAARNIFQSAVTATFPIEPMESSKVGFVETQSSLSGPQSTLSCEINRSVSSVIDHYRSVALEQAIKGPDGKSFYVQSQAPGVQSLVWIDSNYRRLGVVAMRHMSGRSTRYHLFESSGAACLDLAPIQSLPLGLAAPKHSLSYFDFRSPKKSYGYFRTPSEPGAVFRELVANAKNSGLKCQYPSESVDKHHRQSGVRTLTVVADDGQRQAVYTIKKRGLGQTEVMYMVSDRH